MTDGLVAALRSKASYASRRSLAVRGELYAGPGIHLAICSLSQRHQDHYHGADIIRLNARKAGEEAPTRALL